jgi:hypothetical protein
MAQSWDATWHPSIGQQFGKKLYDSQGVGPVKSGLGGERFDRAGIPSRPLVVLNPYGAKFILKFVWLYNWRSLGLGPSPSPDMLPYSYTI